MKKMNSMALVNALDEATMIVHPAPHHGDETMAVAIAAVLEGRVDVYRTRNPKELEEAAGAGICLVDVGGVYSPDDGRYDHHQRDFDEAREDGTLYSSAGLLWKHYGVDACVDVTGCALAQAEAAAKAVDDLLIRGIDLADYGNRAEGQMSVSQAISFMNLNWDEAEDADEAFLDACQMAYIILVRTIKSCVAQVKGRDAVEEAIKASEGGIMVLPQFIGGWIQAVLTTTNPKGEELLYGVFQNLQGQWNCQAIPPVGAPQAQRRSLPEAWRGLSGAALAEVTGVQDAVFCHAGGFICGAKSREGALRLAELAVEAE